MEISLRRAARVLLVDDADRLLMFRGIDPARPDEDFWMTVGGGLDDGETLAEGAARELAEETGLRLSPEQLGSPVWHNVVEYSFDGVFCRQEQDFFLVRVPSFEVCTDGFDELERATIFEHRWWTMAELESTTQTIYPPDVVQRIEQVLAGPALGEEEQC